MSRSFETLAGAPAIFRQGMGRPVFTATLFALGLWGLAHGEVGAIWGPIPKRWPARETLGYVCAGVALISGSGLLLTRTAVWTSGGLFAYLLVWMVVIKGPAVVHAPATPVAWEGAGETAVLAAASWMLFADLAEPPPILRAVVGEAGRRGAAVLYGAALIASGVAHFAYLKLTAGLVPGWLPAHTAWAASTGLAYGLAGAAIITGVFARPAAALCAMQIGAFTLLVWAPRVAAGHADTDDWSEAVISWALTAGAWVIADSYRGRR